MHWGGGYFVLSVRDWAEVWQILGVLIESVQTGEIKEIRN